MKALVFNIRLNSLYSIRIPFTWQSALAYPVLPPSAVIGMLANALQRYKNDKYPLKYLELVEEEVLWAGSKLLTSCIVKSYTNSAVVKWGDTLGGKFTNALGREFAYTKKLGVAAIFKGREPFLIDEIMNALKTTPLTCGDSESSVSIEEAEIKSVKETDLDEIRTEFPVPFTKETLIKEGSGNLYMFHERCREEAKNFPLRAYLLPLREAGKVYHPYYIVLKKPKNAVVFDIESVGYVCHLPRNILQ
ncbi:MAG: CRISPR-associated protein Cas5 [Candidatus Bathyarchaeia archaeon]